MTESMKALWLEDNRLSIREVSVPVPAPGEALLRVRMAGICATDLELVRGYGSTSGHSFTGIIGHEFVAEVVSAPGYPAWIGRRVVGEINITCGTCVMCRSGLSTHCERRSTLGITNRPGVFAEYTTLPLENLHHVPDEVPDENAVFTEPLAAALEILEQVNVRPHDRVLVLGAGRLGQLVAQVLSLTGCDLRVAARYASQQELLKVRGIRDIRSEDIKAGEFDVVVEATGSASGFQTACHAVRPRGMLVLKSTYAGSITANLSSLVVDEVTIVGSRCGPFQPALRLLQERRIEPAGIIQAQYQLADSLRAFEEAGTPGVLKIILAIGAADGTADAANNIKNQPSSTTLPSHARDSV